MASDLVVDTIVDCTDAVLAFTEREDSADAMDDPFRCTGSVPMSEGTSHVWDGRLDSPPAASASSHKLCQG